MIISSRPYCLKALNAIDDHRMSQSRVVRRRYPNKSHALALNFITSNPLLFRSRAIRISSKVNTFAIVFFFRFYSCESFLEIAEQPHGESLKQTSCHSPLVVALLCVFKTDSPKILTRGLLRENYWRTFQRFRAKLLCLLDDCLSSGNGTVSSRIGNILSRSNFHQTRYNFQTQPRNDPKTQNHLMTRQTRER